MKFTRVGIFAITIIIIPIISGRNEATPSPSKNDQPSSFMNGIVTNNNFTPEELVRDIFVKGSCDNVSNIQPIGKDLGIGYFENGTDIIGIAKGIILSSGDVEGAEGPNGDSRRSGNFRDNSGDPDLSQLVAGQILMQ